MTDPDVVTIHYVPADGADHDTQSINNCWCNARVETQEKSDVFEIWHVAVSLSDGK